MRPCCKYDHDHDGNCPAHPDGRGGAPAHEFMSELEEFARIDDTDTIVKLVITGNPVSQKNSKEIVTNRRTGKPMIISNKKVEAWKGSATKPGAIWSLAHQWAGLPPVPRKTPVRGMLIYFLGARQRPDLDNLFAAPLDAMQDAGVLENDSCIHKIFGAKERAESGAETRVEITLIIGATL